VTRVQFRASLQRRLKAAMERDGRVTAADLDLITGDADDYAARVAEETAREKPWPWPPRQPERRGGGCRQEAG
jgi:hypothetical protein